MKTRIPLVIVLIQVMSAIAQPPDTLWTRRYGGGSLEECWSMEVTSDGGYILAGYTTSFGSGLADFWVVRTDANGDSLWSRTYGGTGDDYCSAVLQTDDGGFVLAGSTSSFGSGWFDFWLVKVDGNGDSIWSRTYGGFDEDRCNSLQHVSNGGYALAGYTRSFGAIGNSFWLLRTDSDGDSLWSVVNRSYYDENQICYASCQGVDSASFPSESGYLMVGSRGFQPPMDSGDAWKVGPNGDSLWAQTYDAWGRFYAVQSVDSTDYVLAGALAPLLGSWDEDFWLAKLDLEGNVQWSRTFGGTDDDRCYSVLQTDDGGYVLGGSTLSFPGFYNFWLVRTNASGDSMWSSVIGSVDAEVCRVIRQTPDSGLAMAGYMGAGSNYDMWLVKLGPELSAASKPEPAAMPHYELHAVYPNPFNAEATVSFEVPRSTVVNALVYDVTGRMVTTLTNGVYPAGEHRIIWNGESCSSGVYFVTMQAGEFTATQKIILMK